MRIDPNKVIGEATEYDKKRNVERTKIDSIPKVNLRFHMEDNKKLILLDVYAGKEKHITMWARGI